VGGNGGFVMGKHGDRRAMGRLGNRTAPRVVIRRCAGKA